MRVILKACPRCGGAVHVHFDVVSCLTCGWSGKTVDGAEIPDQPEGRPNRYLKQAQDHALHLSQWYWDGILDSREIWEGRAS